MEYILKNHSLKIDCNTDEILNQSGCIKGREFYASVKHDWDLIKPDIEKRLDIRLSITVDNGHIYVLITAGEMICQLSNELFDKGNGIMGLFVNNAADYALFKADEKASEIIKYYCGKHNLGIKKRLEAPTDIPLSSQAVILEKAPVHGVTITEAFMLSPLKSMGYELVLTNDKNTFNAQHDCSSCPNLGCPRRSIAKGSFDIISDFDYIPKKSDGIMIDIGTTTIVAMKFKDGKLKKTVSALNPQRRFGADVLSRIEAANRGRGTELQTDIEYRLHQMIVELGGSDKPAVIAANTTMVSLLMGFDCTSLGRYPFTAQTLTPILTDKYKIFGGISAFVGGDIVSGLYACSFDTRSKINMLIDLGTNGEMAIGNKDRILCTSTAAGPAFEGGRISCGTGSVDGAICAVDIKTNTITAINDKEPCGICGTGITELVYELITNGYCDTTGFMKNGDYQLNNKITFTQKDMREVQTAKSAIRAGIEILIAEYGCCESDICNIYIAGGFGKRLNIEKACGIGILPPRFKSKYQAIGNSSLAGAVKLSENENGMAAAEKIRMSAKDFSLAEKPEFESKFLEYMNF